MRHFLLSVLLLLLFSSPALAGEALKSRLEMNWHYGDNRSIVMTELWVPLAQNKNADNVLYGSFRMMEDNQDNREGNLGIGYRQIASLPLLENAVAGVNVWLDRRFTKRGNKFNQLTAGTEWLGKHLDIRLNGYWPLSGEKAYTLPNLNPQTPALVGTAILVDTNGDLLEEPQYGFDAELGIELGHHLDVIKNHTDSVRLYAGGFYFKGDHTAKVAGGRLRLTADVTENIQLGAQLQHDDERGTQGFLTATFRFPFGQKKSYRRDGLRARLDESPVRDIDIVTNDSLTDPGIRVPVLNKHTGQAQEVLTVDNSAASGGDGSAENPFNTLAAAQAAASAHTIIYLKAGDGTSAHQDQGITLNKQGQQLIGSGTNFFYDDTKFTTANGHAPLSTLIASATTAPVIGNINAEGDGITITADDVVVAGITVDNGGTGRDGIVVEANGTGTSAQNITITNVTAKNARRGIFLHGTNGGAVSAMVQNSITTANSQHGIVVYDDTNATFEIDLGGGSMGSIGNNVLAGNNLEDLAVDYDGRTLSAMNNWWGQASGPDADDPTIGGTPQIYYGAPVYDGIVGHWTFDTEWTAGTTAYDRSGNDYHATLSNGLTAADLVDGQNRQAINLTAADSEYVITPNIGPSMIDASLTLITVFKTNQPGNIMVELGSPIINHSWHDTHLEITPDGALRSRVWNVANTNNGNVVYGDWSQGVTRYDDATNNLDGFLNGTESAADSTGVRGTAGVPPGFKQYYAFGAEDFTNLGSGAYFNGAIDEVRIYNRALSSSEISEIYRMNSSSTVNSGGFLTTLP